jgi:hypothetical protein
MLNQYGGGTVDAEVASPALHWFAHDRRSAKAGLMPQARAL